MDSPLRTQININNYILILKRICFFVTLKRFRLYSDSEKKLIVRQSGIVGKGKRRGFRSLGSETEDS